MVDAAVHHDPPDPGGGTLGVAEGREIAPGEKQDFLRHVAGILDTDDGGSQPMNLANVAVDEPLERLISIVPHRPLDVRFLPLVTNDAGGSVICSINRSATCSGGPT